MATSLQDYRRLDVAVAQPAPPSSFVSYVCKPADPGKAVIEFQADERHLNTFGRVVGGFLSAIVDVAITSAYATTLNEGEIPEVVDFKINYLKPVPMTKLYAIATVSKHNRMIGMVTCDIVDDRQVLIARAASTCMTVAPDSDAPLASESSRERRAEPRREKRGASRRGGNGWMRRELRPVSTSRTCDVINLLPPG